ncbi:MAG: hypothetical protein RLY58_1391 [Pseudomonadota bacterium]|jgi:hypothetical protein
MPAFARFASHTLALCIALTSGAVYALEAISDADLSSSTGEGIAILPENFSFVMQDEDASYINIIPRGSPKTAGVNRADIYIRNLSITQNDATTTRASGTNIVSWGSGANPFLIAVKSESQPDYVNANQSRAFLRIEAPTYCFTGVATGAGTDCQAVDTGDALSAYNLRLGAQVDLLIKANTQSQGYGTSVGTALNGSTGIGLQAIWNGMSLNGTRFDLFQTPSNSSAGANGGDVSYNSTLGIRALIRLNTDSAQTNNGLRLTTALDSSYNGTTNRLFDANEGIRIQDLDINVPLGMPHYQSLVLGKADAAGNFYLELTRIPNDSDAYNAAYIDYSNAAMITAKTCTSTSCGSTAIPATHGTISMGATTFTSKAGAVVNVGTSKIDGLFIQHLKLTTTGL